MLIKIYTLSFLVLQCYLVINGATLTNKFIAPFLILFISLCIALFYFNSLSSAVYGYNEIENSGENEQQNGKRWLGACIGVVSIFLLLPLLHTAFSTAPDPSWYSDVIPQLGTLYERNASGIQPYYPLEQFKWHPFPVYMPLHWLPLGIGHLLHADVRWVGVLFLALAAGLWGYVVWHIKRPFTSIAVLLPALVLYLFLKWMPLEIAVSFELIIAAYYLVLAAGLVSGNVVIITIGIIACLLSRYTLVFWLPLFALFLWQSKQRKTNYAIWGIVFAAVMLLYAAPFLMRDTSILSKGLAYHNMCYVDQWNGFGNPEETSAFDEGLNFGYYIRAMLHGDMAHRVVIARMIQAVLMLLLTASGILLFRKWRNKYTYTDIALGWLYCFVLIFFMSSPYTFKYYYLPLMVLSATLCSKIILAPKQSK